MKNMCIIEIASGETETAVSKFKLLNEFGNVNLLHNIIDIAYAKHGQLNNFDNIIHFIAQLPWFSDKVISYEVLYNMMEKHTSKIFVFLTQIEKMLNNSYMIDEEPAFVPRLSGLKSKAKVSVNNVLDLWTWKIRNNDYQSIIDFAKLPQVCIVSSYLPQIVKSVYTNDISNFNIVFNFVRKLPLLQHRCAAYKTLLDEMVKNKQIYNSEIIRFAYEVTKAMSSADANVSKPLISQLQKLKSSFPAYVWQFMHENQTCTIQSSTYFEFMSFANPEFHKSLDSDRFVFTMCEGWPHIEGFWKFIPVDDAVYFNIISDYYHPTMYYLSLKYKSNNVYVSDINMGEKWQIEPINVDGFERFRIKNTRKEYVYDVSDQNKYDRCSRNISVWQNSNDGPGANSNWKITCNVNVNSKFVDWKRNVCNVFINIARGVN
ncbi:uncharacterized protein LOC109545074 [Dendroctonus ponderosae]|uniref:uncharacterized protein LOC109545074 n=1 Tax=Dendroctonus ponderosae TaxID=77166 RepID=UPI002034B193|nr:uncharacterized protein LOC109545074 [Dendroctonus ponderosae]